MVILDTNIIIDHVRKTRANSLLMRLSKEQNVEALSISIITVQELYQGTSTRNPRVEEVLLSILSPLTLMQYTSEIAQMAGKITRDSQQLITFADAAIAATAIINGSSLATLNPKDFAGITNLEFVKIKEA